MAYYQGRTSPQQQCTYLDNINLLLLVLFNHAEGPKVVAKACPPYHIKRGTPHDRLKLCGTATAITHSMHTHSNIIAVLARSASML
jgi:hypothetical protein